MNTPALALSAALVACAGPLLAEITPKLVPAGYASLARPICGPAAEIDARLTRYGLAAEPRHGVSGPTRATLSQSAIRFDQEWTDGKYRALVHGDRAWACIVAVSREYRA